MLDAYGAVSLGEVGESHHAIRMMGEYSAAGRLHQCYSFGMLGRDFSPAFFRAKISEFFAGAPDGWPMWAFANHDVPRQVTRWLEHGLNEDVLAKQAAALLLSFEGSICLWQGEEPGQTDTELALEDLTDPQGIAFWPAPVGRDNTRTPMVWDGSNRGGFTTGTPWLPLRPAQLARNVAGQAGRAGSVLEFYREMLAFRRATPALREGRTRFHDAPDPVLAFSRGEGLLCLFNLGLGEVELTASGLGTPVGPAQNLSLAGGRLRLGANAVGFFPLTGEPAFS